MELRYWLANALTGDIGPEVQVQGSPRFTSRFGGGDFTADIMLGHLRRLDGSLDAAAVSEVLSWSEGGKYTLVVTSSTDYSGEWLIWRRDPIDEGGPATVSGFELDGYPAFRSLTEDYVGGNFDQINLAARLLRDAFYSHQPFAITVPWIDSTTGGRRTIDHKAHTAYYDEVLDEISDPVDGFQWRVVPEVVWENHRPVRVERRVEYGEPELRRPSEVRLFQGSEGTRQGNVLSFPRPAQDFSKYAQTVYGWGRGEGAKQRFVGLSDPTLTNDGHLIVTKQMTFSGVDSTTALTALTRAALRDAQELREPAQVAVLADKVAEISSVGDVVPVRIMTSEAWPGGYDADMQVGQVDLRPNGNHLERFDLLAI